MATVKKRSNENKISDDDYDGEPPHKKRRVFYQDERGGYDTLDLETYKIKRVIEDMHDNVENLKNKRKKDKQILNDLLVYGEKADTQTLSSQSSNIDKDNVGYDTVKYLLTSALSYFSVPVLLLIIDQISKRHSKKSEIEVGGVSNSTPSTPNIANINNALFK